jgi:uncharacterized sulfatase
VAGILAGLWAGFLYLDISLQAQQRPNILWIKGEDHGPHLGSYGDPNAMTPVLDSLAANGMIYRHAWSSAPVCAPARTTLISGLYAPSAGAQHMRSATSLPASMRMYPQYLREAGYYCTNNSKEDYNVKKPGQVWDDSSDRAHWRNRKTGQPFFATFTLTESHESEIRQRPHTPVLDPAKVRVPSYHPDTPEVRQDRAQYYDKLNEVDTRVGGILKEIEDAGLLDDTIIFYFADNGVGLPRGKRWAYNSGLNVPLIVYFPEKWKSLAPDDYDEGGESSRLVGFADLTATLLSIAGIEPPSHMQGQAFAGCCTAPAPEYQFGFADRMGERYDMVRAVRDERYIYIRNYMPHRIYGQFVDYVFQTPTMRVWKDLHDQNRLQHVRQTAFWTEKPSEELYDLENDPDEVENLAREQDMAPVVERMREALRDWQVKTRDLGFLPEGEIHSRAAESSPYEMGHDDYRYPLHQVMRMAELASSFSDDNIEALRRGFHHSDSAVRYWAALGALMRKEAGIQHFGAELRDALQDLSPYVRIAAAEALGRYSAGADMRNGVEVLLGLARLGDNNVYVSMKALNAIDYLDERAADVKDQIAALPRDHRDVPVVLKAYVGGLIDKTLADLAPVAGGAQPPITD